MNNKKAFMLSTIVAMFAIGTLIFSTSATTVEQSNSEAIDDIFQKVEQMNLQLGDLEASTTLSNNPYLGEISMFAGNFAPRGWAFCEGQLLPISSNQSLFSLLGTTYGGDGRTTFGLPDLRSRMAMHGGSNVKYPLGKKGKIKSKVMDHGPEVYDHDIPVEGISGYETINFVIATSGNFPPRN